MTLVETANIFLAIVLLCLGAVAVQDSCCDAMDLIGMKEWTVNLCRRNGLKGWVGEATKIC